MNTPILQMRTLNLTEITLPKSTHLVGSRTRTCSSTGCPSYSPRTLGLPEPAFATRATYLYSVLS